MISICLTYTIDGQSRSKLSKVSGDPSGRLAGAARRLATEMLTAECAARTRAVLDELALRRMAVDAGAELAEPVCAEQRLATFICEQCGNVWTVMLPVGHEWLYAEAFHCPECKVCAAHLVTDGTITGSGGPTLEAQLAAEEMGLHE